MWAVEAEGGAEFVLLRVQDVNRLFEQLVPMVGDEELWLADDTAVTLPLAVSGEGQ